MILHGVRCDVERGAGRVEDRLCAEARAWQEKISL
jgi:hypothetical protein